MTDRHFPDDHEVDEWIRAHFLDDASANASPTADQLKAAANDATNRIRANAPGTVAAGLSEWAFTGGGTGPVDRSQLRGVVRQIMVAQSAGVLPLCPHTQQIRPLVLICDPPVIVCTECLPSRCTVIEALGHRWNHQCDRCGVRVRMLTSMVVGGAGHITVSGHLCSRCIADDRRMATRLAERLVTVPRRDRRQRRGGAR